MMTMLAPMRQHPAGMPQRPQHVFREFGAVPRPLPFGFVQLILERRTRQRPTLAQLAQYRADSLRKGV